MSDFFGIPGRWPIAIGMIGLLAFALSWLQGRFDSSDAKKAIAAARSFKPAGADFQSTFSEIGASSGSAGGRRWGAAPPRIGRAGAPGRPEFLPRADLAPSVGEAAR